MAARGAGWPVISRTCSAAWCSSICSPPTTAPPAAAHATDSAVGRGVVRDVEQHALGPTERPGERVGGVRREGRDDDVGPADLRGRASSVPVYGCDSHAGARPHQAAGARDRRTYTTGEVQPELGERGEGRRRGGARPRARLRWRSGR